MINFEKVANFIVDKMSSVDVKSQQCAKVRSPLSKCSKCQDICPQKGIVISADKVTLSSYCLECGLCASVCPTEALSLKEPNIMTLLEKIERTHKNDGVVNISCRRNSSVDEKCIKIPCIGSLTPELLLVMRMYPFPIHMVYTEEQCRGCSVNGGIDLFNSRMEQVDQLIEAFSFTGSQLIQVAKQEKNKIKERDHEHREIDIQRRAFIGSFFGGFRKMPQTVLKNFVGTDDHSDQQTVVTKSRVTDYVSLDRIEILKKYVYEKIRTSDNQFHFLQQPRLAGVCYFCKACTILCPTGALEYREEDGEIILNSDRCSGCNMCVDVCYHKSLQLTPVPLESVMTTEPTTIVRAHTDICANCKKPFIASESIKQCPICEAKERFKRI